MKKLALIISVIALFAGVAVATTTVTFFVPSGINAYVSKSGTYYYPDTYGYIYLPSSIANDAATAGMVPVRSFGATVSTTCTKGTVINTATAYSGHGTVYACYSTNAGVIVNKY